MRDITSLSHREKTEDLPDHKSDVTVTRMYSRVINSARHFRRFQFLEGKTIQILALASTALTTLLQITICHQKSTRHCFKLISRRWSTKLTLPRENVRCVLAGESQLHASFGLDRKGKASLFRARNLFTWHEAPKWSVTIEIIMKAQVELQVYYFDCYPLSCIICIS